MKGSIKLGTFAGIGLYLHSTFLLLLAFFAYIGWSDSGSWIAALATVFYIICLFVCVALHEFGHALTARRFGIKTRDITLLPIGGLARLERLPEKPWQEFLVAVAGPAVNVVIAAALIVVIALAYGFPATLNSVFPVSHMSGNFLMNLVRVNIMLILFNMLPAFPMDGGRVLRSILAMIFPYDKATILAANLGRIMAVVFILQGFGLQIIPFLHGSSILLSFIGIFIWMTGNAEARAVSMRTRLHNIPVSAAMVSDFKTLSPTDSIQTAAAMAQDGRQQDFPVAENGSVVGILTRDDLLTHMRAGDPSTTVGEVMRRDIPSVLSTDSLEAIFPRLSLLRVPPIPVTNRGLLVGLLPLERVVQLMRNRDSTPLDRTVV